MNNSKVIIIGAGPAGISCAIQLKRFNIESIIFEKESIGGLLKNAYLIENYPGFPNGITGTKYIQLLNKHIKSNDLNVNYNRVVSVQYIDESIIVNTSSKSYKSEYLVIASGTKPIIPPDLQKGKFKNNIFTDIYKLGNIQNKKVAIIGAGDCAFDYALNLCNENSVIILNRSDRIKALSILQNRVFTHKNIIYMNNTIIKNIELLNNKLYLTYSLNKTEYIVDYLLIAVGREPNLDFFDDEILDNPNLFQIGDVKNGLFRQTSIAIGDGTLAAMKINSMLTQEHNAGNI